MIPANAKIIRYGSRFMYNGCDNCEAFLLKNNNCGVNTRQEEDCFLEPPIPLGELVNGDKHR